MAEKNDDGAIRQYPRSMTVDRDTGEARELTEAEEQISEIARREKAGKCLSRCTHHQDRW